MLTLQIIQQDIDKAHPCNRARCVIAVALKRQLELNGNGYISVEANEIAYSRDQVRYVYHPPKAVARYLRTFDEQGAEAVGPTQFKIRLLSMHRVAPPASRERKDQINKARQIREMERQLLGLKPKTYARYAGI